MLHETLNVTLVDSALISNKKSSFAKLALSDAAKKHLDMIAERRSKLMPGGLIAAFWARK